MKPKNQPREVASSEGSQQVLAAVANHPFFRDLRKSHLKVIAGCAMQTKFSPGDLIFRQGDLASRFYLIESGSVDLEIDLPGEGIIRIQSLGLGDALGWSWLFPPHVWRFSARATAPTRAIFFYGTWLRELGDTNTKLGGELFKRMAQVVVRRLQATQLQLLEATRMNLRARLQTSKNATPTEPAKR